LRKVQSLNQKGNPHNVIGFVVVTYSFDLSTRGRQQYTLSIYIMFLAVRHASVFEFIRSR